MDGDGLEFAPAVAFAYRPIVLDIIGFLLLAYEWQDAINLARRHFERDMAEIPTTSLDGFPPDEFRRRLAAHDKEVGGRTRLFRIGAALILLGFVGQLIGSWPQG